MMEGKIVIVTGANCGIGRETALGMASKGCSVVLACRSLERGQEAVHYIQKSLSPAQPSLTVLKLDLVSTESIKDFVEQFKQKFERLHVLINNAGVFMGEKTTTSAGLETSFACNHLGHFYLTHLLLDMLKTSAPSRIVNVSSIIYKRGKIDFDDINFDKKPYDKMAAYGQSKLANILFTRELANRLKGTGVTTYSIHPGGVDTNIDRNVKWLNWPIVRSLVHTFVLNKSPTEGAQTSIMCASDAALAEETGKFYENCKEKGLETSESKDEEVAKRLWEMSENMLGIKSAS